MSASTQESDTLDEPRLSHRRPPSEPSPAERIVRTKSPPMAPGIGGYNIPLPSAHQFEGDLAVKEMRRRLSARRELIPGPPIPRQPEKRSFWSSALPASLSLVVLVAVGLTVVVLPDRQHPVGAMQKGLAGLLAPLLEGFKHAEAPVRHVVAEQRGIANEPLPLGVSLNGQAGNEMIYLGGLAAGTTLTSGAPLGSTGWRLPGRDLGKVLAQAPRDYVGTMDALIDVRAANNRLMDSQIVRLEWIPKTLLRPAQQHSTVGLSPTKQALETDEVEMLVRRGAEYLKLGDLAAARLVLGRAAAAGSATAAFALASSYDPQVLLELGVLGFAPDVDKARTWYQRARELGSSEASRRIDRLASTH